MTARRPYDALLLDLDGTLLHADEPVEPRVAERLRAAREAGVHVMVVTGRSEDGTRPVLAELGLDAPAVVYNGAAVFCPRQDRLIEERVLSDRTVARVLAFADGRGLLTMVQRAGEKVASRPRDAVEEDSLRGLEKLRVLEDRDLPRERVIRVTLYSPRDGEPGEFEEVVRGAIDQPVYTTAFPLSSLARHRSSRVVAVDVHPPCRGKAEALRLLDEELGVPPARVVAVGDAPNDVPMIREAGLGVAMAGALPVALEAADRVIGPCGSDAIADLVQEVFGL